MDALSLLSVGGGLAVAALSVIMAHVLTRVRERQQKAEQQIDVMSRYRDPLLWAAFDLQSRLFNIVYSFTIEHGGDERRGFIGGFLASDNKRYQSYARLNTAFLFAEYLCWAEIMRQEVRFLDLGKVAPTRQIMFQLWEISDAIGVGTSVSDRFRLFRGEQRAIGELMVAAESAPGERRCIGYAEFCQRFEQNQQLSDSLRPLMDDIDDLVSGQRDAIRRLVALQHRLVELIDLLDSENLRFPSRLRTRISVADSLLPDVGI